MIRTFWFKTKPLIRAGLPEEYMLTQGNFWPDDDKLLALARDEGIRAAVYVRATMEEQCFFKATASMYLLLPNARLDGTVNESFHFTWLKFKFPNRRYAEIPRAYPAQTYAGFYNGTTIPLDPETLQLASSAIALVGEIGKRYLTMDFISSKYPMEIYNS
jgi:hypothetical protein